MQIGPLAPFLHLKQRYGDRVLDEAVLVLLVPKSLLRLIKQTPDSLG